MFGAREWQGVQTLEVGVATQRRLRTIEQPFYLASRKIAARQDLAQLEHHRRWR